AGPEAGVWGTAASPSRAGGSGCRPAGGGVRVGLGATRARARGGRGAPREAWQVRPGAVAGILLQARGRGRPAGRGLATARRSRGRKPRPAVMRRTAEIPKVSTGAFK